MNEIVKRKIEQDFIDTCKLQLDSKEGAMLLLPVDDRWVPKIPKNSAPVFFINIINWSKEQTRYTNEVITIVTAFNDIETTATFNWSEVIALLTPEKEMLLTRSFQPSIVNNFSIMEHLNKKSE